MRFEKYLNENYKKALNIGEPETGGKYSDDAVARRIKEIEAGIKDANKLPDNEAKEGILADLEDKLDKWQNVDKETEAPKAAAPPEGEEGEGEEEEEAAGEEEADAEAEEEEEAKGQEEKEKDREDKEVEKDDKAMERDEKREKDREKKEKEREKKREKGQKKESMNFNFKQYMHLRSEINEKLSIGDKVKVINKDDEYYGKKGTVHKVNKGSQTVKLDGIGKQNIVSFNDDELKKL
jgi:hypothetical protein